MSALAILSIRAGGKSKAAAFCGWSGVGGRFIIECQVEHYNIHKYRVRCTVQAGQQVGYKPRSEYATEEEWQAAKSRQETLPKAAFQFGVKMADGRKSQSKLGKGKADQKINTELQKIQARLMTASVHPCCENNKHFVSFLWGPCATLRRVLCAQRLCSCGRACSCSTRSSCPAGPVGQEGRFLWEGLR